MKNIIIILYAILLSGIPARSQEAVRKSVEITIYNDGLGVVKEKREVDLKKGECEIVLKDIPEYIVPESVRMSFAGKVLEQNFRYDFANFPNLIQKYFGKEITLFSKNNRVKGKLLSATEKELVLKNETGASIIIPDLKNYQIILPKSDAKLYSQPMLVWSVLSGKAGKSELDITYHTAGLTWEANYLAQLNESETALDINAWVTITNNSGVGFKDADLKLLAGAVNREPTYYPMIGVLATEEEDKDAKPKVPKFKEKEFFDYHLYELENRVSVLNNETKQIKLFSATNVKITKKYKVFVPSLIFPCDFYSNLSVELWVEFLNSKQNNLGVPIPKGLFKIDKTINGLKYMIGEDKVGHTPKNETVSISVSQDLDLKVASYVLSEHKLDSNRVVIEIRTILENNKNEDVVINVIEIEPLFEEKIVAINSNDVKYTNSEINQTIFEVPVSKKSKRVIKYTIIVDTKNGKLSKNSY